MRTNKLGRTGLFVSELCLGTMTFGGGEGMWKQIVALDQTEAERLDQLDDNIAATEVELTEQELDALGQISALLRHDVPPLFPMTLAPAPLE